MCVHKNILHRVAVGFKKKFWYTEGMKNKFYSLLFVFLSVGIIFAESACSKKDANVKAENSLESGFSRIVSLSPAGTEILCSVGAMEQIVARTDFCDFPKAIKEKPSVGGFSGETLSIETILYYKPDFVYGTKGIHDSISQVLEQAGVAVYLSDVKSTEDVLNEIAVIGSLTGHAAEGLECYKKIKNVFNEVNSIVVNAESKPLVYYEVWSAPFMSIGNKSYIAGLINTAGGINVFEDVDEEYPLVSEEAVVARMPEIIIIPDMNGESTHSISGRHGWSIIPAVKNKKVYFADSKKEDAFSQYGDVFAGDGKKDFEVSSTDDLPF